METTSEVHEELQRLAGELRKLGEPRSAERIEALTKGFYTTTSEYLVEVLTALEDVVSTGVLDRLPSSTRTEITQVHDSAKRLLNFR
jgi:hypothetical protein